MEISLDKLPHKSVVLLSKYVNNLLTQPENKKLYKINIENKNFTKHILVQPVAFQIMLYLNFIEINNYLELHQYSSEKLIKILCLVKTALLQETLTKAPTPTTINTINISSTDTTIPLQRKTISISTIKKRQEKTRILQKIKRERQERRSRQKQLDFRNSRAYQLNNRTFIPTHEKCQKTIEDFSDSEG